jgi:hypothetical protein
VFSQVVFYSIEFCCRAFFSLLNWCASSLEDVQKRLENINTDEDPSGWRPSYTFFDRLQEKYAKNDGFQCTFIKITLTLNFVEDYL